MCRVIQYERFKYMCTHPGPLSSVVSIETIWAVCPVTVLSEELIVPLLCSLKYLTVSIISGPRCLCSQNYAFDDLDSLISILCYRHRHIHMFMKTIVVTRNSYSLLPVLKNLFEANWKPEHFNGKILWTLYTLETSLLYVKPVQADLMSLCFIVLHTRCVFLFVCFQIEGKTLCQQNDYDLLYCSGLELNLRYLRGIPVFMQNHCIGYSYPNTQENFWGLKINFSRDQGLRMDISVFIFLVLPLTRL